MQKLLDRLRFPRARAGRTHGGFGFAPPPLVSRAHATYAALGVGMLALVVAGAASFRSAVVDEPPARLAAAPPAQGDPVVAAVTEAPPAPAEPSAAQPGAVVPVAEQVSAAPEPPQPSAATTARTARPTLADAQAMQRQAPPPAAPILSFQSPYEDLTPPAQPETTAAIGDEPASEEPVAMAESDPEIAQLEAQQQEENEALIQEENGNAFNSPIMGEARANQHVNLRAGPSDNARVLMVVPVRARIQAAKNCAYWCEVVYEGKRGFIYKSFIARDD